MCVSVFELLCVSDICDIDGDVEIRSIPRARILGVGYLIMWYHIVLIHWEVWGDKVRKEVL